MHGCPPCTPAHMYAYVCCVRVCVRVPQVFPLRRLARVPHYVGLMGRLQAEAEEEEAAAAAEEGHTLDDAARKTRARNLALAWRGSHKTCSQTSPLPPTLPKSSRLSLAPRLLLPSLPLHLAACGNAVWG
jgi:hypothetical protein